MKTPTLPLATAALAVLLAAGCGKRNEFVAPPPPPVTVATPEVRDVTTYHTYPDLLFTGGRLAASEYPIRASMAQAVQITIDHDSQAVVLRATGYDGSARGLMPGGLGV